MKAERFVFGILALTWLPAMSAAPLAGDSDQPITIEADWAEADDKQRVAVYKGAVVITQGSLRISGDTVTIHYDEGRELTKLVAEGEPARFQQRPDPEEETQHAKATLIEYDAAQEQMVLQGNAHYWQGTDCLRGNRIVYHSDRDVVEAQGDKEGKERVRITLLPGDDDQPDSATECVE